MKAQASVELFVILAVSLIILVGIAAIANERLRDISTQKAFNDARATVRDLADAANSVYMQGVGARKKVFIEIPDETDLDNTLSYIGRPYGIGNETPSRTINLHLRGGDVFAITEVEVQGAFPSTAGGHWCWVQSFGTYVSACRAFLRVEPGSIYVVMERSSIKSETIRVINEGNESADISLSFQWAHSDVTVNASSTSFSLSPYEDKNITITFSSSSGAIGVYSGMLTIDGNSSSMSDTIDVPISADVPSPEGLPLITCAAYCIGEGYEFGICRESGEACGGEEAHESGGDTYCPVETPACCCGNVSGTCDYYCRGLAYLHGTCRANESECFFYREVPEHGGDGSCTEGPRFDTCCCFATYTAVTPEATPDWKGDNKVTPSSVRFPNDGDAYAPYDYRGYISVDKNDDSWVEFDFPDLGVTPEKDVPSARIYVEYVDEKSTFTNQRIKCLDNDTGIWRTLSPNPVIQTCTKPDKVTCNDTHNIWDLDPTCYDTTAEQNNIRVRFGFYTSAGAGKAYFDYVYLAVLAK